MAVDRSVFVPEFFLPPDGPLKPSSCWTRVAAGDPRYDTELQRDEPLVTKVAAGLPVSSSTKPSLMALMLDLLEAPEGARVLEIGTGTGYNAALLAQLAGPGGWVVSVEFDPDVAAAASARLREIDVTVVCGEGLVPFAPRSRISHLIATCGCRAVWDETIGLLEEDGTAVLPLVHGLDGAWCPLNVLARRGDELVGRVAAWATFMPSRGGPAAGLPGGGVRRAGTPPDGEGALPEDVARMLVGLGPDDGASLRYFLSVSLGASWWFDGEVGLEWAGKGRAEFLPGSGTIRQWGDAEVVEGLLTAVHAWDDLGRPDPFLDYEVVLHRPRPVSRTNTSSPRRWSTPRGPLVQTVTLCGTG